MSAIFGETLTLGQKNGPDIRLIVTGDAYYARHETLTGYTVVYDSHYRCALLQADGHRDLERNVNQGDGNDLFGTVSGAAVSSATTPSSRLWDGPDSGLVISDVGVPDDKVRLRLGAAALLPAIRAENATAMPIPDNIPAGITSTIQIAEASVVKQLKLSVDITHTYTGDLVVDLTGPGGQKAIVHNRGGGGADNLIKSYDLASRPSLAAVTGQSAQGIWSLSVMDVAGQDVGKLNRWSLEVVTEAGPKAVRGEVTPKLAIPDNNPTGVSSSIPIAEPGTVRQLKVSVDITHRYIGDLRLELVSPVGRRVMLHSQLGGSQDNSVVTYDSAAPLSPLRVLVGLPIQGDWVLRVVDRAAADEGTLNKCSLELLPAI